MTRRRAREELGRTLEEYVAARARVDELVSLKVFVRDFNVNGRAASYHRHEAHVRALRLPFSPAAEALREEVAPAASTRTGQGEPLRAA